MAKSIRSKAKRKARAEFRRTLGEAFHQKKMAEVQEKLKATVEQQSLNSLDKLATIFDAAQEDTMPEDNMEATTTIGIDAVDDDLAMVKALKGENKAPVSKKAKRSRKHGLKSSEKKQRFEERPKRKPKFFVQF